MLDIMVHLATFFDIRYLSRGLALYESLLAKKTPFFLWILCMDTESLEAIKKRELKNAGIVSVQDLERFDNRVSIAKNNRSTVEFYFTIKSFLCKYILEMNKNINLLTYIDADTYFFGNPEVIIDTMNGYSIALSPHRFSTPNKFLECYGKFNAGFISFRNDAFGLSCLNWWTDQCFSWCHDYLENNRYADQLYLDQIPEKFSNVLIADSKGINLAPWNINDNNITADKNGISVNGSSLVFFHFHGLKKINDQCYDTGISGYKTRLNSNIKEIIYLPYLSRLRDIDEKLNLQQNQTSIRYEKINMQKLTLTGRIKSILSKVKLKLNRWYYNSYIFQKS